MGVRRYRKLNNEAEKQANIYNMQLIGEEATLARECGISYGKLKANIGSDYVESEYPVHIVSYVTKTKTKGPNKTMAFIKQV